MNNAKIKRALLLAIGGVFVWWAWKSPAQDAPAATTSLQMPYAVTQVLELEQAKVGDSTVIAYIRSSGTSYNLNATQIVFLRQQGVSDAVITAMLTQPRTDVSVAAQAAAPAPPPAPAPQYASAPQYAPPQYAPATSTGDMADPTVITQPPVTYVQTPPVYYNYSYNYPYPYYAYYGGPHFWFPWSIGWTWYGGGWHWGWHGGSVGWHGGSAWHGSWGGGWHGGWSGHGSWSGGSHGGWGGGGGHGGGHR